MICLEFKEWLIDKDFADKDATTKARSHMQKCSECRALYTLDEELEAIIRADMLTVAAPPSLLRRIDAGINLAKVKHVFGLDWRVLPILATAALLLLLLNPFSAEQQSGGFQSLHEVGEVALADHLRHVPMAFVAKDVADVEGWFAAEYDMAFTMPQLDSQYVFVGGRRCQLGKCDVVYLLYSKAGKRVSVFILPETDIAFPMQQGKSYGVQIAQSTVQLWREGGQVHAMVI